MKKVLYKIALTGAKLYWKLVRPRTHGGRVLLIVQNEVLLVNHNGSSLWNLPGGGIGAKENPETGALRELYEETKIKIPNADYLLGTYTSVQEGKQDTIYVYVKETQEKPPVVLNFEINQAQWFPLNSLPENISPATQLRIDEYLQGSKDVYGPWRILKDK